MKYWFKDQGKFVHCIDGEDDAVDKLSEILCDLYGIPIGSEIKNEKYGSISWAIRTAYIAGRDSQKT